MPWKKIIRKPNSNIGEFSVPTAMKEEFIESEVNKELVRQALNIPIQLKWYQRIWNLLKV